MLINFNYALAQLIGTFLLVGLAVLVAFLFTPFFQALSGLGFFVICFWLSWQISKLCKALYDALRGQIEPSGRVVLITGKFKGPSLLFTSLLYCRHFFSFA